MRWTCSGRRERTWSYVFWKRWDAWYLKNDLVLVFKCASALLIFMLCIYFISSWIYPVMPLWVLKCQAETIGCEPPLVWLISQLIPFRKASSAKFKLSYSGNLCWETNLIRLRPTVRLTLLLLNQFLLKTQWEIMKCNTSQLCPQE